MNEIKQQKYIRTEKDQIIIFPKSIDHSEFKSLNPVSAGFCFVGQDSITCNGYSDSLNIDTSASDTVQATIQFFGIDAAFKL